VPCARTRSRRPVAPEPLIAGSNPNSIAVTIDKPSVNARTSRNSGTVGLVLRMPSLVKESSSTARRDASRYGSGRSQTAFSSVKVATLAPTPSASIAMTAPVDSRSRPSDRMPYRRSCRIDSSQVITRTSRMSSAIRIRSPKRRPVPCQLTRIPRCPYPVPTVTRALLPLGLVFCLVALSGAACRRSALPVALSDKDYWALIEALSEPAGTFDLSDNLVSNEPGLAENVRKLGPSGGAYIGVGPEQNFSYIARLRPAMAFIIDIRRENRNLHLLYKALFTMSSDRADFVSRLFSRPRPTDLASTAGVDEIFRRYSDVPRSLEQFNGNLARVHELLLKTFGFPLSETDLAWIDRVFKAFYADGPEIHFWGSSDVDALKPSYRQLMTARDSFGVRRSFLATDEAFGFVRELQGRNVIVPVVGDFGGRSAIRRVGDYIRERGDEVQAFYGSNVGVYLTNQQTRAFCGNLASLPAASGALFIERDGVRSLGSRLKECP
jgi:hypothetical protein